MALDGIQKRTFLPYLRGVPPEDLRLGSLYMNPLEPNDGLSSLRWEFMRDEEDQDIYDKAVSKWTRKRPEIDQPFSIKFEASKARSLGFSFTDFVNFKGEKNKESLVEIQGLSGRRIKIKEPEEFLKEVLKAPGVQSWICKHASLAHKGSYGRHQWNAPKIWMVTAIQHVTGGTIHSQGSTSRSIGGALGGDASLAAHAPPGTLKAKLEANHQNSTGATTDFGHEDERIWAAQFMPVSIAFGPEEDALLAPEHGSPLPKSIATFRLQDVPDLGGKGFRQSSRDRGDRFCGVVPKLIARVTVNNPDSGCVGDDADGEDGLVIDDALYVANDRETDWEQYEKYQDWVRVVERGD
ncbi:hypothetical protein N0V95_005258 [Ascochyta clinopodiicola]|nr:hypothetical protein N0V95_005258 [Ascochyta clinopodiicola]